MSKLALLGGTAVMERLKDTDLFKWPIIAKEDEDAILEVVKRNGFSGFKRTVQALPLKALPSLA